MKKPGRVPGFFLFRLTRFRTENRQDHMESLALFLETLLFSCAFPDGKPGPLFLETLLFSRVSGRKTGTTFPGNACLSGVNLKGQK